MRKQEFGTLDNSHPRLQEARQTGKGAWALGASSNAFEALACYGMACVAGLFLVAARVV